MIDLIILINNRHTINLQALAIVNNNTISNFTVPTLQYTLPNQLTSDTIIHIITQAQTYIPTPNYTTLDYYILHSIPYYTI